MSLYSRFLQLRFLVCVLVFLHCSLALAQINSSDLQFRSKSVLIETRLSILVGKYVPPLFVQYADKSNRTTASSEKTAITTGYATGYPGSTVPSSKSPGIPMKSSA